MVVKILAVGLLTITNSVAMFGWGRFFETVIGLRLPWTFTPVFYSEGRILGHWSSGFAYSLAVQARKSSTQARYSIYRGSSFFST